MGMIGALIVDGTYEADAFDFPIITLVSHVVGGDKEDGFMRGDLLEGGENVVEFGRFFKKGYEAYLYEYKSKKTYYILFYSFFHVE